jgi:uncharacterized Zn finger protein
MLMYRNWRPYVPVARRRSQAKRFAAQLAKDGRALRPIELTGRTIARTFWGKAWCDNLENYSDFENRLPRGRTYVRNGSVIDLQVAPGVVTAIVSGSDLYQVRIDIKKLGQQKWQTITRDCSQSIDSVIDLLQGRFSKGVMARLTREGDGLFPKPAEIKIACNCPDWAVLCKHAAAVIYGIGARLDEEPELLFVLRDVDHTQLISQAVAGENLDQVLSGDNTALLAEDDLGALFGIELDQDQPPPAKPITGSKRKRSHSTSDAPARNNAKKKVTKKKVTKIKNAKKKTTKKRIKEQTPTPVAETVAKKTTTKRPRKKA